MIGTRLGPYEITAKLGEGGMGEVWRATDIKLRREVAIKVLPEAFSADPERVARFEREAQLLAQLQHQNIASIYGMEESDGRLALIMELVEGPTLAERLESGPLPLDETLAVARQIAEALEEAHEKGIVHRDLKPANVKIDLEGRVKILDFGLAKAMSVESGMTSVSQLANSPTLAAGTTVDGMILGTAAYMAPEQAKGKPVDKRADNWVFGVVLFEMLVGHQLFEAETLPETLGAIFRQEIDLDELPATTPPHLRRLVERCLERDPKHRLRDIGEARIALEGIVSGEGEPLAASKAPRRHGVPLPAVVAAVLAAAAIAALLAGRRSETPSPRSARKPEVTEFSIWVGNLERIELSPDGRRLSWLTHGRGKGDLSPWSDTSTSDTLRRLWVRDLDDRVPREVTADPDLSASFWSPDGSELAVVIGERLWRIPAAGGEPTPICELPLLDGVSGRGVLAGAWLPDDTILFAAWRGGIYRVLARGGDPTLHVPIDPQVDVDFHQIVLLPDGKSLVLAVHRQNDVEPEGAVMRLELFRDGRREALPGAEELGEVAPIGFAQGILVFVDVNDSESAAWGVPFDAVRGAVTGKRFPLQPRISWGSVGADGTLAYIALQEHPSVVARVDRTGAETATLGAPHPRLRRQALSPDGTRLAVVLSSRELWVRDLERGTLTRLISEESFIEDPQWSPDSRTIYYTTGNDSLFRRIRADPGAAPETVLTGAFRSFLAPDGSGILVRSGSFRLDEEQGFFWVPLDAQGRPGERRKLFGGLDSYGRLAPGGRLLAYGEGISGRREAFLTTFPELDQTIQLSANGGGTPQWSADGKSVYYLSAGALIEVRVGFDANGRLTASTEKELFDFEERGLRPNGWSPAPDGDGFLVLQSLAPDARSEIVVVRNGLSRTEPPSR